MPSNDSIEWFTSTNDFVSYSTTWIGHYNASFGSAVFTRIGGTNLQLYSGSGGEVTGTVQGPYVFGAYTTRMGGTDTLVSVMSADSGAHWKLVNVVSAPRGAIETPVAAPSPAGYVYLTWRENGAGPWEVDLTVLSDSGTILLSPQSVPNSGGRTPRRRCRSRSPSTTSSARSWSGPPSTPPESGCSTTLESS